MNSIDLTPSLIRTPVRIDSTATDDGLLAAITAGSQAAAGILYRRHVDTLRTVAVATLPKHDETSADDVVQDVFVALLEGSAGTFQPARGMALPWLKGMVRREAMRMALTAPASQAPPPPLRVVGKRGDS